LLDDGDRNQFVALVPALGVRRNLGGRVAQELVADGGDGFVGDADIAEAAVDRRGGEALAGGVQGGWVG
jgi:hypothetical protein